MPIEQTEAAAAAVAVAPRVTLKDINASIASEKFIVEGTLTICVLTLKNGFMVTGESAAASPENFNAQMGMTVSRDRAKEKIWPLLGYELRSRLNQAANAKPKYCNAKILAHARYLVVRDYETGELLDGVTEASVTDGWIRRHVMTKDNHPKRENGEFVFEEIERQVEIDYAEDCPEWLRYELSLGVVHDMQGVFNPKSC